MSLPNSINVPKTTAEAVFKDRGSKFIAFVYRVKSEEEVKKWVQAAKKEHPSAVHWCWAYVLGLNSENQKSTDDREPSGSAGKPILFAILKAKLTETLVVVVRYFGGKLLGVPGLINAYGTAAAEALSAADTSVLLVKVQIFVPCAYQNQHQVIRIAKQFQCKSYPDNFELEAGISLEVPPQKLDEIMMQLNEARLETYQRDIKLHP